MELSFSLKDSILFKRPPSGSDVICHVFSHFQAKMLCPISPQNPMRVTPCRTFTYTKASERCSGVGSQSRMHQPV